MKTSLARSIDLSKHEFFHILPNKISTTPLVRKLPSFVKLAPEKPRKFESNLKTYQALLGTTLLFIHSKPKVKLIQKIIEAWNFTS